MSAGFTITGGKGFRLTFANGWTISVQFGVFNYCEHHDSGYVYGDEAKADMWRSRDAEIAVIKPDGRWYSVDPSGNEVIGWQDTDSLAHIIALISAKGPNDE